MARNYAALPHEYLEEMELLSDEEFGRLMRALLKYSITGEAEPPTGPERMVFPRVRNQEDRFQESYRDLSSERRAAGKKGAASRWQAMANDGNGWQNIANDGKLWQADGKNGNTKTNTNTETNIQLSNDSKVYRESGEPPAESPTPSDAKPKRHKMGRYGWVKLSDEEYSRLSNELGEDELKRCIAYVDESAQSTGNKNKWRDWNLVIRKCHRDGWGLQTRREKNDTGFKTGNPFLEMLDEMKGVDI